MFVLLTMDILHHFPKWYHKQEGALWSPMIYKSCKLYFRLAKLDEVLKLLCVRNLHYMYFLSKREGCALYDRQKNPRITLLAQVNAEFILEFSLLPSSVLLCPVALYLGFLQFSSDHTFFHVISPHSSLFLFIVVSPSEFQSNVLSHSAQVVSKSVLQAISNILLSLHSPNGGKLLCKQVQQNLAFYYFQQYLQWHPWW